MKNSVNRIKAYQTADKIMNAVKEHCQMIQVCGSLRRGQNSVGDIDIVYVPKSDDINFRTSMIQNTFKMIAEQILIFGDQKQRIILNGIQVDLVCTDEKGYGACCLYLTGSRDFNIICRSKAKKKNLKLNEHGLFTDSGTRVADTEYDILKELGMTSNVNPESRNVEFARRG